MKINKRKTLTPKELLREAELFNLNKTYHEVTKSYILEIEDQLVIAAKDRGEYLYSVTFTQKVACNMCNYYQRTEYNQMYLGSVTNEVLDRVLNELRVYFTGQGFFVGMENLGSREDQKFVVSCLPILSAVSKN